MLRGLLLIAATAAVPFSELINVTELKSAGLPSSVWDWIPDAGAVETNCQMQVQVGLDQGSPLLRLILNDKVLDLEPWMQNMPKGPLLCHTKKTDGPALLSVSSSVDYLWHYWPYFANKVVWAASVGLPYYLWIGEMTDASAHKASKECSKSPEYSLLVKTDRIAKYTRSRMSFYDEEDENDHRRGGSSGETKRIVVHSNHHIKMLAALATLSTRTVSGLYYFDMDAIVSPKNFKNLKKFHHLLRSDTDGRVDVLFGQQPSDIFWHVKGSHYYIRNTQLGRRFMAAWFGMRCGFKDQYSLWHAVLTLATHAKCLDYHGEIYQSMDYYDARRGSTWTQKYPDLIIDCAEQCRNQV